MRILLDTNALLWLLDGDERLGRTARGTVERAETLSVSVASLWEISIKVSLGKLETPPGLRAAVRDLGFERLEIRDTHLDTLEALPSHHRDPFDRLLISQAMAEGVTVMTSDAIFTSYGVPVVDARS